MLGVGKDGGLYNIDNELVVGGENKAGEHTAIVKGSGPLDP